MRAPLDVNLWITIFDDAHQFSDRADLFIAKSHVKIATCQPVENGVMRVVNSPLYSRRSRTRHPAGARTIVRGLQRARPCPLA